MIAVLDDLFLSPLAGWVLDISSASPDALCDAFIWIMGSTIVGGAICFLKRFIYD